jgi:hypothetical protein
LDVFRRNEVSVPWSAMSWLTSRRVAEIAGLKYFAASLAGRPLPWYHSALPLMNFCSPSRVLSSRALKSWSMSTTDVVLSLPITAPSSSAGLEFGPGERLM